MSVVVDDKRQRRGSGLDTRHQAFHVDEQNVDTSSCYVLIVEGVPAEWSVEVDWCDGADHVACTSRIQIRLRPKRPTERVLAGESCLHKNVVSPVIIAANEVSEMVVRPYLVEPWVVAPHFAVGTDPGSSIEPIPIEAHGLAVDNPGEKGRGRAQPRQICVNSACPGIHSVPALHRLVPEIELVFAVVVAVVEACPRRRTPKLLPVERVAAAHFVPEDRVGVSALLVGFDEQTRD
mmetsp:Transcript_62516/g.146988  ORF Transcript_62516/g.146988 Transcript_62516/m.146988 type:complete len:235 (+) Transcript_62516:2950-3654(+)